MDRGTSKRRPRHPRETSNILSLLSFFYSIKLFTKGFKKSLDTEDLHEVLESCRSKQLADLLESQWTLELKKKEKPSITITLFKCFGKQFVYLGIIQLIFKVTLTTCSPQALSKIIAYFSPGQTELTKNDAIYYTCIGIGLTTLNLFVTHQLELAFILLGIRVRTAVCSLLYRKSLNLSGKSLADVTVGKIVTVMSKDIDTVELFIEYGHNVWIGLVQTIVICYLIYSKIGVASFAGIAFLIVILPLQLLIGRMSYSFRLESCKKTDERLEITQEILSAIKIIKMYCWERYFEGKISESRKKELKELHKIFISKMVIVVIGRICSKIGFFIFLMTHVWLGNSISAEIVYYIMSCFNDLEYSLSTLIPFAVSQTAEAYSTAKRVESILHAEEISKNTANPDLLIRTKPEIAMNGAEMKCGQNRTISNIHIKLPKSLNVVVGQCGSGKTTLIRTILGDSKNVQVSGTISYASQEPWLFPSSIKNNILFGEQFNSKRYSEVLSVCALKYDLELLNEGDATIVGDRGINLSKGQQARINLARAVYKQSDIYLLDDCLAALDGNVSDIIFNKCVKEFLADKLVVFVTNNFNYIKEAKQIVIINNDGVTLKENDATMEIINNLKNEQTEAGEYNEDERQDIFHEEKKCGQVGWSIYYKYIQYGGGVLLACLVLALFILEQSSSSYSDKLMSEWVTLEQNLSTFQVKNTTEFNELYSERTSTLNLFTGVVVISQILTLVKSVAFFNFSRMASIRMHQAMVACILHGKMSFFDSSFIGNLLNRFSIDLMLVDEWLPFTILECLSIMFLACGSVVLLSTVNYILLIESVILLVIAIALKIFYQPTGRNLQRLNSQTKSPMVGHINSTFEGLLTIRASKAQDIIRREFERHQDLFTSANYAVTSSVCIIAFYLDFFCSIYLILVIIQFISVDFGSSVGDVGLAITQAFVVTDIIILGIKDFTICENTMTSFERVLEYTQIEQEDTKGEIISNWPQNGEIRFENVALKYKAGGNLMLSNINFGVGAMEKVGIVGRTGAGKSSIISSLLRLYKCEGRILIDNVDIKNIGLKLLRSQIAVIPQDPFIFTGTVRNNIDPLDKHSDAKIWALFSELHLSNVISDLNMKLDKSTGLSAGQKQLFCLARAILQNSKIIVLDEATANVDHETDIFIQETIKRKFANCTVVVIAHRLLSVLHCSKVLVLNRGQICEFDEPSALLENKNSFLHCVIK